MATAAATPALSFRKARRLVDNVTQFTTPCIPCIPFSGIDFPKKPSLGDKRLSARYTCFASFDNES
jgi:hypothetical protein